MIKLVNVSKYYSSNNVIAMGLRKANLELHTNEFVAIVGESGSGKTTLLNVICGIDTYEEGELYINGEETSYFNTTEMENYRKKYVAFVFQNYNLIDSYTVLQNVEAPMILAGYPRKEIRKRALEIIDRVGLTKHIHHKATKLSGGQKQRVVIARALAKDCPIIAADEPTGNLDSESGKQILELLYEISKEKLVILVTHDFDQVKAYATRKIRIYDGEIVEDITLKKVDKKDLPTIPDAQVKIRFWDLVRMALHNLLAVPKKTILLMMVLLISTFFVAWMYGTFSRISSQAEGASQYYPQFLNISPDRLVLRKADASIFSDDDLSDLQALIGADYVIDHDYVMDNGIFMHIYSDTYSAGYQTAVIPASLIADQASLLLAGELPDANDEVAVILSSTYVQSADIFLGTKVDKNYYTNSDLVPQADFTVVGVFSMSDLNMMAASISYQETELFIAVSDSVYTEYEQLLTFNNITSSLFTGINSNSENITVTSNLFRPAYYYYGDTASMYNIILDESIADNRLEITGWNSSLPYEMCIDKESCLATGTLTFSDFYRTKTLSNITVRFEESNDNQIRMNSTTFALFVDADVYQVSLIGNVDQMNFSLPVLHAGEYLVTYPYEQSKITNAVQDIYYFLSNMLASGLALFFVILVTMMVTYLITRLVYNTKLRDYAIFRTIGANQNIIRWFIYLENTFMTTGTYLLFLPLAIYLKLSQGQYSALYGFSFYTVWSYIVLYVILLLIAFFNSRKYCRKIFKESVNRTLKNAE